MRKLIGTSLSAMLLASTLGPAAGQAPAPRIFRASAAKVDVTPSIAELPAPFNAVRDPIHARAVVMDDGASRAAIVVIDGSTFAQSVYADLVKRIAMAAGAPVENVLLSVTHSHNAVRLDPNPVGIILPGSARITAMTVDATVEAVKTAAASLQPAKAGYATGSTEMVADRALGRPGPQESGKGIDRTVGVLRIDAADGQPIAFVVNSALEPVAVQARNQISGDIAGVAERYIEDRYGGKAVALYTVSAPAPPAYSTRPAEGRPAADEPALTTAMGTILAEEALAASAKVKPSRAISLAGAASVLQCPGKVTTPLNNRNSCSSNPPDKLPACTFTDRDTGPVQLNLGVLRIGEVSLVQADANITSPVWQKLKSMAPANTALFSLYYGPVHYVVDDADYPSNSYPVTASTAKRGCAAQGFIDRSLKLIGQTAAKGAR